MIASQEETREESKSNKKGSSDENLALVSKTSKGKGMDSNKMGCYRTDCSLGKAQPKPQRCDNYGSIYPLSP
jgi:hypothetical protein